MHSPGILYIVPGLATAYNSNYEAIHVITSRDRHANDALVPFLLLVYSFPIVPSRVALFGFFQRLRQSNMYFFL